MKLIIDKLILQLGRVIRSTFLTGKTFIKIEEGVKLLIAISPQNHEHFNSHWHNELKGGKNSIFGWTIHCLPQRLKNNVF